MSPENIDAVLAANAQAYLEVARKLAGDDPEKHAEIDRVVADVAAMRAEAGLD